MTPVLPRFRSIALRAVTLGLIALLAACSGGGSGGGGGGSSSGGNGSVGVLVTDGPADEFAKLWLDVTRIELIGSGGKVTIFEGRRTLDLLALRDDSRLLGRHRGVPAGKWSKIRLRVDDAELIRVSRPEDVDGVVIRCPDDLEPEDGYVCESIIPTLVANGKIDLNPREPFRVRRGELVLVQLDLDANKSLFLHETGNGRWMLRPVVFVDVFTRRAPERLVKIEGIVRDRDLAERRFDLCETHADRDRRGRLAIDLDTCVDVRLDGDTSLFDLDLEPARLRDFANGDRAGALGRFRVGRGEALVFDAEVVQEGGFADLDVVSGEVLEGVVPGDDPLEFEIAPDQIGFRPSIALTVGLQPGAKLFTRGGVEVDPADLRPGQHVRAIGLYGSSDPNRLDAVVVFVRNEVRANSLRGVVAEPFDAERGELTVNAEDGGSVGPRCVAIEPDDDVFRIVDDADMLRSERISPKELEVGEHVDVYGRDTARCFDAETVVSVGLRR